MVEVNGLAIQFHRVDHLISLAQPRAGRERITTPSRLAVKK